MRIKKIISCVLCAALLLTFLPAPAHAVTLTAINDSILPLDESTMPARLGGETYVPYSVFTTLGVSASENDGVLDLSANGETLSFSTAEGYVYDQNLNSYSTPAYEMNGTVYVPVKLCCAKFGFTYSSLTLQGENVLRVADGSAQSDSAFIAAHTKVIENTIDNYKDNTSGSDRSNNTNTNPAPAKPVDNDTIEIPKVEEKPAKRRFACILPITARRTKTRRLFWTICMTQAGRRHSSCRRIPPNGTMIWFVESQRRDIRQLFCCRRTAKPTEPTCWRILLLRTNA